MSRRLALLILVLMLACLACSMWLGGQRQPWPNLKLDLQLPNLQDLRNRLTVPVASKDLRMDAAASGAGCLLNSGQFAVPVEKTCVFTLTADPRLTRQVRLALSGSALEVSYRLEQPGKITIDGQLRPDELPVQLDVFANEKRTTARLLLSGCKRPPLPTPEAGEDGIESLPCFVELSK